MLIYFFGYNFLFLKLKTISSLSKQFSITTTIKNYIETRNECAFLAKRATVPISEPKII